MGKYKGRRAAAFIFDLDGTLIDSGQDIALSANFTRGHFQLSELPVETTLGYVGDGVVKLLERVLGHNEYTGATGDAGYPVAEDRLAEGLEVFRDHYQRHLLDNTTLYPGVLDLLARYRRFPLHVATNKPQVFTEQILAGLHLDGAFRRVVGGDQTSARKPDPAHLKACLDGLDVDARDVVVVGDSPNDIQAARSLGAISVGCTFGLTTPGLIRSANPDHTIDHISELAGLFPSRTD